ncbi:MAG: glycosyltransferase family 2 protein [Chitinispirillales bacterium]|nr:glycosyltransferase family 2 protein [Chitinispirillales bacterium]
MTEKNENILVSVVMAFHNGDNTDVAKITIGSILSQTHKNFELIVSVGGEISAEKNEMLRKYVEKDARVKILLSKINTGPSFSRNRGIEIASGKYVSIADSDDIFFEDKIEKQLNKIIEKNLDFLGCGYLEFRNNYKTEKTTQRILPKNYENIKKTLPFANPMANSALFIKTHIIKEFLYDEKFRPGDGEDYDLTIRLLKAGKLAENIAQPLFFYRLGGNFEKKHANIRCSIRDLQHKLKAAPILPFWWFPAILLSAILAFIFRLLPPEIFRMTRNFRHVFFGGKNS